MICYIVINNFFVIFEINERGWLLKLAVLKAVLKKWRTFVFVFGSELKFYKTSLVSQELKSTCLQMVILLVGLVIILYHLMIREISVFTFSNLLSPITYPLLRVTYHRLPGYNVYSPWVSCKKTQVFSWGFLLKNKVDSTNASSSSLTSFTLRITGN